MTETIQRNLSITLRPRRFSEVIGQDDTLKLLQNQLKDRVPVVLMFVGSPGCGKTTTALILARSLNCTHSQVVGEPCESCVDSNDFEIIEQNMADRRGIDEVRELTERLDYYPTAGKYRVLILDEFQQTTDPAQNLLLKPMEAESSHNIFILCTTDPGKIIAAIKSRAQVYQIKDLSDTAIKQIVVNTALYVGEKNPERISQIATALIDNDVRSGRTIVNAVDKFAAGATIEQAIISDGETLLDFNGIANACLNGQWNVAKGLLAKAAPNDATNLRIRVGGYYRKVLLGGGHPKSAAISNTLLQLANINAYESGIQLSAVVAILFQLAMVQGAAPFGLKK